MLVQKGIPIVVASLFGNRDAIKERIFYDERNIKALTDGFFYNERRFFSLCNIKFRLSPRESQRSEVNLLP